MSRPNLLTPAEEQHLLDIVTLAMVQAKEPQPSQAHVGQFPQMGHFQTVIDTGTDLLFISGQVQVTRGVHRRPAQAPEPLIQPHERRV